MAKRRRPQVRPRTRTQSPTRPIGDTVLRGIESLPPGLVGTSLPNDFAHHPLVRERYFFVIPRRLLEIVERRIGSGALIPEILDVEYSLADVCDRFDPN